MPTGEAFVPSNEDKDDATKSGNPVRVSVWDRKRTQVAQAEAFRQSEKPLMSFLLDVEDVLAVREKLGEARLRVVEDPIEKYKEKPGGDGHCGIEGLDRQPGGSRLRSKAVRDEIALRTRPADEEKPSEASG